MADIMLTHSAKGTSWQKKGAAYISRKKVNGKWVYTYNNLGKRLFNNSINNEMDRANYGVVRNDARFLDGYPKSMVGKTVKQVSDQHYSNAESLKRKQVSGQRNIEKDPRYKLSAKTAYLKNKASRAARKNVAKGKKKVSEILSRLRKSASSAAKIANRKYKAAKSATNKVKKKVKNAVSVKETAYITDVSTGKRRPAPTDLFDNAKTTSRKKKMSGSGTFITSDNKRIKVNPTKKMSGSGTFITSDNKRIKVNPTKKMSGSGTFITSDNKKIKVNPTKKMSGSGTFITSDNKRIKVNPTKKMSGSGTFITSDNKRIKVNRKKKRKS